MKELISYNSLPVRAIVATSVIELRVVYYGPQVFACGLPNALYVDVALSLQPEVLRLVRNRCQIDYRHLKPMVVFLLSDCIQLLVLCKTKKKRKKRIRDKKYKKIPPKIAFTNVLFLEHLGHATWAVELNSLPAGIYLLKFNNRNTRTRCEICSKLAIKTP